MSTAITITGDNPRNRKAQVFSAIAIAKAGDADDFASAIPITADTGAPNHAALVVGELYIRTDTSRSVPTLYRAITAGSASAASWECVDGHHDAITAASTAVSGTSSETDFDQTLTIPASLLTQGTIVKIRAQGIATATNSTDTLAIKLYVGSTAVVSIPGVDVANNDIFYIDFEINARAAPAAAAACVGSGVAGTGTPGTLTAKPTILASTNFATNAALTVKVSATWSTASGSNSCRLDVLSLQVL